MPVNLSRLDVDFERALKQLLGRCETAGFTMRPYSGLRGPVTQGRLWRQSRTVDTIIDETARLIEEGADYLGACIVRAGPQAGKPETNKIPGLSWHQFGLAADCFLVDQRGEAVWTGPEYLQFGLFARQCGLTWSQEDAYHVQMHAHEPLDHFGSLYAVDRAVFSRWGDPSPAAEVGKPQGAKA